MDEQTRLARQIGRDLAQGRALITLIGSPRKNEPLVMQELLRTNFEMGKQQITARLVEANLPIDLARMVEDGMCKTADAILDGVRTGAYHPPSR